MLRVHVEEKEQDERAEKVSEVIIREHTIPLRIYSVYAVEPRINKLSQVKLMTKVQNRGLHL